MRVRTPGLFSTRIDRTCLRPVRMLPAASSSSRLTAAPWFRARPSLSPPCPARPRRARSSGTRSPRASRGRRPSPGRASRSRRAGRRRASSLSVRRMPVAPWASASLTKSGNSLMSTCAVALVPEQLLPLADHAQVAVVDDEHLDVDALGRARAQLLHVHLHRAVAGDADDGLVGQPTLAPMAAGRPKPIVPRPPDWIQRRGLAKLKYCAAHIWCWPMSVETIASGRSPRRAPGSARWGRISRAPRVVEVPAGARSCQPWIRCHHSSSRDGSALQRPVLGEQLDQHVAWRRPRSGCARARSWRSRPGRCRCG